MSDSNITSCITRASIISAPYNKAVECTSGNPKLYIDTAAIKNNFFKIRSAVGPNVEIMPILKANAYGIGIENVAHIFDSCNIIAVADCSEAVAMKRIMPQKNILILYQPDFNDINLIVEHGFTVCSCSLDFLKKLNESAKSAGKLLSVHISIDSGFGRLGVYPDCCREFAAQLALLKNLRADGLFTHFSCADSTEPSDMDYTKGQIRAFNYAVSEFEASYGAVKYKHTCSSGGIFLHTEARFNMVRPGYLLYGYYPSENIRDFITLTPSLKLSAKILYIKDVPGNTAVSYGRKFISKRKSRIATVAIGYSDGLHRSLSNGGCFAVNGQKAPIAGTVCMDIVMLDVTDIQGDINVGDEVFVFDNSAVTLDDVAAQCGTIGYEVLSHISRSVCRCIV